MTETELDDLLGSPTAPVQPRDEYVTADALGDLLGLATRNVNEMARRGILKRSGRASFPLRASVRSYCAHLREAAAGRTSSTTLTDERIRVAREQADKLAMANAIARREMVPAREVESEWAAVLRDVRAAMLALPSRVQFRLGHLTAHDVSEIDHEIRDVLSGAAQ